MHIIVKPDVLILMGTWQTSAGTLAHSSHSFPGSLHRPMYFPPKYKMSAQLLLLNQTLDFSLEDESLVNSDDDFIPILAAVATYMGRHGRSNPVDLVRRSWVRFPPRSKENFLYLVWFPDSLY